MSRRHDARHRVRVAGLLAVSLLAAAMAHAADDEEFPPSDLVNGKRTTHEECAATKDAVWVEHKEGTECIRYHPSSKVQGAKQAVLFFHGDLLDGRFLLPGAYDDNRTRVLRVNIEQRRPKEYLTLNAAVDAIKERYGLERVLLGGQSGGAIVVGALLTLGRTDVLCAAAASGAFDVMACAADIAVQSGRFSQNCDVTGFCDSYNVTDHVAGVAKSDFRRIFIIGDPEDTNTAFKYQQAFVEKLKSAGHDATLVEAEGRGPQRHGLTHMANRTLGWCNAGYDSERIASLVRANALALRAPQPQKAGSAP